MQEPENERQPDLIIRASSLSEMLDCGARWAAKHLLGKRLPAGAPAAIGTAIHAGTAVFDTQRLDGGEGSVEDAIDAAVDSVKAPKEEVRWNDVRPAEAIDIAARVVNGYCNEIAPKFIYRKVEQKLNNLDVRATNGLLLRFTGNVDRQYVIGNGYGTCDLKSGKQVVNAQGEVKVSISAAQLGVYELLELMSANTEQAEPTLPAMIVALPTGGKQSPKIVTVNNPRKLLLGDEQNKGLIDVAASLYKNDLFFGNPRSLFCAESACPIFATCRWRMTGE